jgi:hypothetical protein
MKTVLIFNRGDQYDTDIQIKEFDEKEEMVKYINEKNIGKGIMAAYEIYKEIEIEPFEKVLNYRIKE